MPILPNIHGLELTKSELEMLDKAARVVWGYWYRPVESNQVSDGIGHLAAGFLAAEIARYMREKRDYKSKYAPLS